MAEKDLSIGNGPTLRPESASGARRLVAGDTILGRYAVVRELGEGGMGVVYQCLDTVGGVEVAVKGLPPEVSRNADEMEDIRANYQIVRKLRHPNITSVTTLEKDAAAGDYYLVMDLAAGTTLKRWARRHPDAGLDAKLAILRQVAAALDYAHAEKVIHRDVKPENVMVDDNGRVKVLDFGLAAQIRSSQSRTSTAVTSRSGTWGYMSPEQWRAKPQREQADVYSFGVMAYWLFAGHLPFDGDDPAVLGPAVLSEPVEPIAGLPAHMNAALVKALAKKPDERFASCGAFMDALEGRSAVYTGASGRADSPLPAENGRADSLLPAENGRAGAPRTPQSQGGSRSRVTTKIFLAIAALALAAAGGWWFVNARAARSTGATGDSPVSVSEKKIASPKPVSAPAAKPVALKDGDTKTFILPGGVKMEMVYVAPGSFQMGSSSGIKYETPHRVRLTKGYWIGKYPVTQAQWNALVSSTGVSFEGKRPTAYFSSGGMGSDIVRGMDTSDFPMENISWNDCKALVDALNKADREGWRWALPTEAQWEFAARGGNKSRGYIYSGGDDMAAVGWYYENSGTRRLSDSNWKREDLESNRCRTHSVKEKDVGNELGIVGMSGNVGEWCNDWYDKDYYASCPTEDPQGPASGDNRVLRGGSWFILAWGCRSADRDGDRPGYRSRDDGFRLCCSAGPREGGSDEEVRQKTVAEEARERAEAAIRERAEQGGRAKWHKEGVEFTINDPYGLNMTMKWCPAGWFTMGSQTTEEGRDDDETLHLVTLTKGFWMGQTEVTQGQWKKLMDGETVIDLARKSLQDDTQYMIGGKMQTLREFWGLARDSDPHNRCGDLKDNVPVYNVSWNEAVEFCRRLTEHERTEGHIPDGYEYRLPTEAEWEYACRAGTTTALPNGRDIRILGKNNAPSLDDIAWYGGNSSVGFQGRGWDTSNWLEKQYDDKQSAAPREIRGKQPNNWGLYDMIGNVWEWCGDWYGKYEYVNQTDPVGAASGASRVNRGGSWGSNARSCRSAYRGSDSPGFRNSYLGFRIALAPSH